MSTAATAAVAALQVVSLGENHIAILHIVVISTLDGLTMI
jgi:hypothetical protein